METFMDWLYKCSPAGRKAGAVARAELAAQGLEATCIKTRKLAGEIQAEINADVVRLRTAKAQGAPKHEQAALFRKIKSNQARLSKVQGMEHSAQHSASNSRDFVLIAENAEAQQKAAKAQKAVISQHVSGTKGVDEAMEELVHAQDSMADVADALADISGSSGVMADDVDIDGFLKAYSHPTAAVGSGASFADDCIDSRIDSGDISMPVVTEAKPRAKPRAFVV